MTPIFKKQSVSNGRTVIFGANGFIGRFVAEKLKSSRHQICCLGTGELNLLAASTEDIAEILRDGDRVVFLSALTPDRGNDKESLKKNIKMAKVFLGAAKMRQLYHVVYVSTDGVYPFGSELISENSSTQPVDAYTQAHLQREEMFLNEFPSNALCIVRPTQVFGVGDPHRSYGPCRFMCEALKTGSIVLFGAGEETRDYISASDVGALICRLQGDGRTGIYNLATGISRTVLDVAATVANTVGDVEIKYEPRMRPITHRAFDISRLQSAFVDYKFREFSGELASMKNAKSR